jgi:hypothetical protein
MDTEGFDLLDDQTGAPEREGIARAIPPEAPKEAKD